MGLRVVVPVSCDLCANCNSEMPRLLVAVLLLALWRCCSGEQACTGPFVELVLHADGARTFVGSLASFGPQIAPAGLHKVPFFFVGDACGADVTAPRGKRRQACTAAVGEHAASCVELAPRAPFTIARDCGVGALLLAERGNCSFVRKARNAQRAGAQGVVVFNSQPGACVSMGAAAAGNDSGDGTQAANVTIPCLSVSGAVGATLLARMGDSTRAPPEASLSMLQLSPVDAGATLLLLLAAGSAVAGAWWAGEDAAGKLRGGAGGLWTWEVATAKAAGVLVVVAVPVVLLLWFQSRVVFGATVSHPGH